MRTNELEKGSGGDDEFGQYMYLHMLRKAQRGNSTWATFPWISVSFIIRSGGSSTTFSLKCRGRSVVRAAGDHRGPSHRWTDAVIVADEEIAAMATPEEAAESTVANEIEEEKEIVAETDLSNTVEEALLPILVNPRRQRGYAKTKKSW